jgi:hypothetical protein
VRDPLEELPLFGTELSLKNAQNNSNIEVNFDKKLAKKYQSQLYNFSLKTNFVR